MLSSVVELGRVVCRVAYHIWYSFRMPTPAIATSALQLKVILLRSKPPIWRRVKVPSTMNLGQFHMVIQVAFGWTNSHLHDFTIEGETYGPVDVFGDTIDDVPPLSERSTKLSKVLGWAGAKARYTYDFGDGWDHEIVVEKVTQRSDELPLPLCTDGKRRCPPEDCGGIYGYYKLLEALTDLNHDEHDDLLEWVGGKLINPVEFSIEAANDDLSSLRKKPGTKKASERKAN